MRPAFARAAAVHAHGALRNAFAAHLTRLLGAGKVSDIRWWQITD